MSLCPSSAVLPPTVPQLGLLMRGSTRSDADRDLKKRRWSSHSDNDAFCKQNETRAQGPKTTRKQGVSAAHELRMLRAEVASMEEQLRGLKLKWTSTLPDERTLAAAYRSAFQKYAEMQTEATRSELQRSLLEQQILFATLQTAVLRAPLHSRGADIHEMLHFDTHLGRDPTDRDKILKAHFQRALTAVPSIMTHITGVAIKKDIAERGELRTPLSQLEVTGCADCTLVSSIFMSEIPHTSMEVVYAGVLAFFDSIPMWMKRHFGVDATHTRLNRPDSPIIYWRSTLNGVGLPAIVNHIVCSELTPSHGMVHMDAITNDPLNPIPWASPLQYGICGLTFTPHKDPTTGKTVSITLRWAAVYRYSLLPNDPALKADLEIVRPILNGDLITSCLCDYIQEKQPGVLGLAN